MPKLIGTAPNQVPVNGMLGNMAFQNKEAVVTYLLSTTSLTVTGSVINALGSAAAPSYTFTGDTNTGIYSPTADTIAFVEGGVEAMRIDSSGNLLVGTTSGSSKVTVAGVVESTTGGFKFPDGTTQTTAGGAVSYPQNIQSGNYTLALSDAGKHIYSNNTAPQIITLPTNASVAFPIGSLITIVNDGTAKIVLSASGVSIFNNGSTSAVSSAQVVSGMSVQLLKTGTNTWKATFGTVNENTITASYLVIAGGASGGRSNGGGGGGGGYLESATALASGAVYTITVGAGGAGVSSSTSRGLDGSASSLSGTGVSVTSIGGGGGGTQGGTATGRSGGSGGGGAYPSGAGGAATSGQGFAGGAGSSGSGNGGGGGGSEAAGISADAGSLPSWGGSGLNSSITGTSVGRAGGGGGGGLDRRGVGRDGGGSGAYTTNAVAGTANTGGGGGGGSSALGTASGAGGSGVVILSIPTVDYTGITTGSPTVTTSGSNTILTFTSSGTYTA